MPIRLRITLSVLASVLFLGLAIAGALRPGVPSASDPTLALLPMATPRIRAYCDVRYILYFAASAWTLIGLWVAVRAKAGERVCGLRRLTKLGVGWRGAASWVVVSTGLSLWMLVPSLAYYLVERSFGFAVYGPALWAADRARDLALELAWAPLVGLAYVLASRSPHRWWVWTAAALVPLGVLMTIAYPVVINPMYNKYRPLEDATLRSRLLRLAERAGLETPEILVADKSIRTTKLNAYVTGIGPTHRIVLWDTLLKGLDDDEIAAITAHELGHYAMRHIWLGLLLHSAGGIAILWLLHTLVGSTARRQPNALGIRALSDPAGLPGVLLILNVLLLAQTPLASAISRSMERSADAYGLELCGDGAATARVFAAFGRRDYADPDPPRFVVAWLYTHPPLRERIREAAMFVRTQRDYSGDSKDRPPG